MRTLRNNTSKQSLAAASGNRVLQAALSTDLPARFVRVLLVFSLVFTYSLHLEYIAFADDEVPQDGSITQIDITLNPEATSEAPYQITEREGSIKIDFEAKATWTENQETTNVDGNTTTEQIPHEDYDITDWFEWSADGGIEVKGNNGKLTITAKATNTEADNGVAIVYYKIKESKLKYLSPELLQEVKKTDESGEVIGTKTQYEDWFEVFEVQLSGQENPEDDAIPYVSRIDILNSDNTEAGITEDGKTVLRLESEDTQTYTFHARVVVIPDSNNPDVSPQEFIVSPGAGLNAQTAEVFSKPLPDISWTYIPDGDNGENAGTVEWDEATGEFTFSGKIAGIIRCTSSAGPNWTEDMPREIPGEIYVTTEPKQEEEPTPDPEVDAPKIYYEANGGSGSMDPTVATKEGTSSSDGTTDGETNPSETEDGAPSSTPEESATPENDSPEADSTGVEDNNSAPENYKAQVAASSFEAPKGKQFKEWNTEANPTEENPGTVYKPGSIIDLEPNTNITLYAQWVDAEEAEEDILPALPDDGKLHVMVTLTPAPKGKTAILSPLASGVEDTTFGYFWQMSTDKGATWTDVENKESAQALYVPVNDSTIGNYYRVKVIAERIENNKKTQEEAISEPVELQPGNAIMLSYEPVEYGKMAKFTLSYPDAEEYKTAKFEWRVKKSGGKWEPIKGITGANYEVETVEGNLGNWYIVLAQVEIPAEEGTASSDTSSSSAASSAQGPQKVRSNVQMLVARVPNYEVIPGDTTIPGTDDGTGNDGVPFDESEFDNFNWDELGGFDDGEDEGPLFPDDLDDQIEDGGGMATIQNDDGTTANVTPIDNVVPANGFDPKSARENTVIADNSVAEQITGEKSTVEENLTRPGSKWRQLDVLPSRQAIQQVLHDNPFAPFVVPLALAVMAAGMVEALLSYRRQRRPSTVAFS